MPIEANVFFEGTTMGILEEKTSRLEICLQYKMIDLGELPKKIKNEIAFLGLNYKPIMEEIRIKLNELNPLIMNVEKYFLRNRKALERLTRIHTLFVKFETIIEKANIIATQLKIPPKITFNDKTGFYELANKKKVGKTPPIIWGQLDESTQNWLLYLTELIFY